MTVFGKGFVALGKRQNVQDSLTAVLLQYYYSTCSNTYTAYTHFKLFYLHPRAAPSSVHILYFYLHRVFSVDDICKSSVLFEYSCI